MNTLNSAPTADRIHISFFGVRNAGKSSLVNAVTGQAMSVVSDIKGTTTDPVRKAMELLPLGAVIITDTPGFDDTGSTLAESRVKRTRQILETTDIAVLVTDSTGDNTGYTAELVAEFNARNIPYIIARNKADLLDNTPDTEPNELYVSAKTGLNIHALKELIGKTITTDDSKIKLIDGLVKPKQTVLLIMPQDSAAPKGRLILPEQQAIRDILESDCVCIAVKETEITDALDALKNPPDLVITDSQVFKEADKAVPDTIPLTSFSMLYAKLNGVLATSIEGVKTFDTLKKGDRILISEGCTHHRQCDDIGTVKLPNAIRKYTKLGDGLDFEWTSGNGFPEQLTDTQGVPLYAMCIHCGGCMLRKKAVLYRMRQCSENSIPFTNYGVALAFLSGILDRAKTVFTA